MREESFIRGFVKAAMSHGFSEPKARSLANTIMWAALPPVLGVTVGSALTNGSVGGVIAGGLTGGALGLATDILGHEDTRRELTDPRLRANLKGLLQRKSKAERVAGHNKLK